MTRIMARPMARVWDGTRVKSVARTWGRVRDWD